MKISRLVIYFLIVMLTITAYILISRANNWNNFENKFKIEPGQKVIMLILDSADPDIIDFLLAQDQLPNFQKMRETGFYARQKTIRMDDGYIMSLPVIGTILTGRKPSEHGMLSHVFLEDGPEVYYPFSQVPVPLVWDIITEEGLTTGVVGTIGNMPIDEINGYIVSHEYIAGNAVMQTELRDEVPEIALMDPKKLVYPSFLLDEVNKVDYSQENITFLHYGLEYDFPPSEQYHIEHYNYLLSKKPNRLPIIYAKAVAMTNKTAFYTFMGDFRTMQVSKYMLSHYRPNLFIEYLPGLDYYGNLYHTKEYTDYNDLNSTLFRYMRFLDSHIGDMISEMDKDTVLIVLSDHGSLEYTSYDNYNIKNLRKDEGILYIYGPEIPHKEFNTSVYDVMPTVLHLLNVSNTGYIGRDLLS